MSIERFLDGFRRDSNEELLSLLQKQKMDAKQANFTANGNAVKSQEAQIKSGNDLISLRFYNRYDPRQITAPKDTIKTTIEVVTYKNGNATGVRTLYEKKSKSLKNAKANYEEVLDRWKRLTKQKTISFGR